MWNMPTSVVMRGRSECDAICTHVLHAFPHVLNAVGASAGIGIALPECSSPQWMDMGEDGQRMELWMAMDGNRGDVGPAIGRSTTSLNACTGRAQGVDSPSHALHEFLTLPGRVG